jgi:hypothetical protein
MEINRNNYETFFLLYLDRELNLSEMSEVERFVNDNGDLQKEFSILSQTVLIPAHTEFDQKELLFRKEEKRRVIPVYWTRIAAAVAVLVLGTWLITTQLSGKLGTGIAGSDNKKSVVPVKNKRSDQKVNDANNTAKDPLIVTVNKNELAGQQNITATKNQSVGNTAKVKTTVKLEKDLSGKNNPVQPLGSVRQDIQNPSSGENPEGSVLAMQKSIVRELQPVDSRNELDPKQILTQPGSHSTALLIAATGATENVPHVRDDNAAFVENEDQSDNAISVVALNDKNKGITRLFKKLTRRAPAVENDRKVRISVFQFSY